MEAEQIEYERSLIRNRETVREGQLVCPPCLIGVVSPDPLMCTRHSTREEEVVSETWSAETPSPSLSPGLRLEVSRCQLPHNQVTA